MMPLVRLYALAATVLTCLEQREKRGGHRQKVYADKFTSHLSETVNELFEQIRKHVQICAHKALELPSELTESASEEGKNGKCVHQARRATRVFRSLPANCIFITVETEWNTKYLAEELGRIYDCSISEVKEEF